MQIRGDRNREIREKNADAKGTTNYSRKLDGTNAIERSRSKANIPLNPRPWRGCEIMHKNVDSIIFARSYLTVLCPEAVLRASWRGEFFGTGFLPNTFTAPLGAWVQLPRLSKAGVGGMGVKLRVLRDGFGSFASARPRRWDADISLSKQPSKKAMNNCYKKMEPHFHRKSFW